MERKRDHYKLTRYLDFIKAEVQREVTSEMNPDGKPKFPNETSRNAEIISRLDKNQVYTQNVIILDKLKNQIDMLRVDLDYERDMFRACRALTRMDDDDELPSVQ